MNTDKNLEKTYNIITSNNYLCLSTSAADGKPWSAPLYYAYDSELLFYFFSAKDSLHARHIRDNSLVAFSIFNSSLPPEDADGVQIEATARQVHLLELPHVISTYYRRRFPDEKERSQHEHVPMDFRGISLRRFFRLSPIHVYTLDPNFSQVDQRVEVPIPNLVEALKRDGKQ